MKLFWQSESTSNRSARCVSCNRNKPGVSSKLQQTLWRFNRNKPGVSSKLQQTLGRFNKKKLRSNL